MLEARSNHGNRPKVQSIYKGGDSLLAHTKKANITSTAYLEPNRNTMQKPIEGLPVMAVLSTKKRRGKGARENDRSLPKSSVLYKRGL